MEDTILFMDCGINIFIYRINLGIGCFFFYQKNEIKFWGVAYIVVQSFWHLM